MSAMYDRIAFTMLPVQDVARARAFYEQTLGLTSGIASEGGTAWVEYNLPGGGCLAITNVLKDPSPGGTVAFEVLDLDGEVTRLKGLGIEPTSDLIESPVCRMVAFNDSEGNPLMLHQLHDQTRIKPAEYGLIGTLTATSGNGPKLAAILAEGTQNMPGCVSYDIAADADNADILWVTERWVSKDHHEASLQLDSVKAAITVGRPLIAGMERVATLGTP